MRHFFMVVDDLNGKRFFIDLSFELISVKLT